MKIVLLVIRVLLGMLINVSTISIFQWPLGRFLSLQFPQHTKEPGKVPTSRNAYKIDWQLHN